MIKEKMTSRERVLATVKGLPVDRIPVYYWLNPHAACKMIAGFEPSKNRFWNTAGSWLWKGFVKKHGFFSQKTRNALPHLFEAYANNFYVLDQLIEKEHVKGDFPDNHTHDDDDQHRDYRAGFPAELNPIKDNRQRQQQGEEKADNRQIDRNPKYQAGNDDAI